MWQREALFKSSFSKVLTFLLQNPGYKNDLSEEKDIRVSQRETEREREGERKRGR